MGMAYTSKSKFVLMDMAYPLPSKSRFVLMGMTSESRLMILD